MSKTFQGHVEGSVPGNNLLRRMGNDKGELGQFGLRTFSHVGRLVQLPEFALRDLIISSWNNRLSHVSKGLIVSDFFVCELILHQKLARSEGIEGSLSFIVHSSSVKHHKRSSVEVSNGKLYCMIFTSLRRRYPTPHPSTPF